MPPQGVLQNRKKFYGPACVQNPEKAKEVLPHALSQGDAIIGTAFRRDA
ncbi:MAG: hypothetical protein ACR2OZ_03115 [Verrucomicrobiales bacterium]